MSRTKTKPKKQAYKKPWDPSPEEIAEECRKIREEDLAAKRQAENGLESEVNCE